MPWPNDVITRTVYGTYLTALGAPARGRVVFTPTTRVLDESDAVIIEDAITAVLDSTGYFEVELPTTDNSLLSPKDWAYDVSVRLFGVKPQKFYARLPHGNGSSVDLINDIATSSSGLFGSTGIPTTQGPVGPRGPGVLIGDGLPQPTTGFDGDIYIDTSDGTYYGPKASGQWPLAPTYIPVSTSSRRYVHTQQSPTAQWDITHTLGGRPSVTVVDSAGTVVIGEIAYNSDSSVTIFFTSPFSGYAYLT